MITNNKGQSSIEFILMFTVTFTLVFLWIVQAYNLGVGYLAHYANFMASRTYLTHDTGSMNTRGAVSAILTDSQNEARRVYEKYHLELFVKGSSQFSVNAPLTDVLTEYVGTFVDFDQPFSFIKFIGGNTRINLRTESFLGKESPRAECKQQICQAMFGQDCDGINASLQSHITAFDDGC
ncbi:MAG: hypothetical protein JNM93_10570 [Bacteriovoracaceae bacterium]|nr:hypothetical protein [Bacteriovoracaceae bacterium]